MSFESVIYSRLANDATLQGLCSQIFPQQPVDNPGFPFCWYVFTRKDRLYFGNVATGISDYTFEINCFATSQANVIAIANRIIALLDGYSSSPNVGSCRLDAEAQAGRPGDGYIYFVKSLRFVGLGT